MSAEEDRKQAEKYAAGDILAILYRQHADITESLDRVSDSKGEERSANFAAATKFIKKHETAEQALIRPVIEKVDGGGETTDRNAEEKKADQAILALSKLDVDSTDFDSQFATLKSAVSEHAESEETIEFPIIEKARTEEQRIELGQQFLEAMAG